MPFFVETDGGKPSDCPARTDNVGWVLFADWQHRHDDIVDLFRSAMGFYPLEKYVGNQNMARPSFRFSPFGPSSEFKIFSATLPETNISRTPEKNVAWNRSSLPFEMVWNGPLLMWWRIRLFSFSAVFKVHVLQQLWHCGVFTLSSLCANSCAWSARKSSVSSHDFAGPLFTLNPCWGWFGFGGLKFSVRDIFLEADFETIFF